MIGVADSTYVGPFRDDHLHSLMLSSTTLKSMNAAKDFSIPLNALQLSRASIEESRNVSCRTVFKKTSESIIRGRSSSPAGKTCSSLHDILEMALQISAEAEEGDKLDEQPTLFPNKSSTAPHHSKPPQDWSPLVTLTQYCISTWVLPTSPSWWAKNILIIVLVNLIHLPTYAYTCPKTVVF